MRALSVFALSFLALALNGCVTRAVSTTSSSDIRAVQGQLQPPVVLEGKSEAEVRSLVEEALQSPIDFHGIVVDEQGEPVPGVTVRTAIFDHVLDPFEFPYVGWTLQDEIETGGDGRFVIDERQGSGMWLRVYKEGWKSVGHSQRHVRFAAETQYLNNFPLPTTDQPMRFVMRPGLPLEDYFLVNTGAVLLPPDGSEIEVRLDRRDPYGVDPGQGDLAVSCDKEAPRPDGRWDWFCRVRMTNGGGLRLRHDWVIAEAPENGYVEMLEWGQSADDPDWDHRDERYVYVRARDEPYFGHLVIRIRTAGDFFFDIDGMVNITGRRDLEVLFAEDD